MSTKKETKKLEIALFDVEIDGLDCYVCYHPLSKSLLVVSKSLFLPTVAGVKRFVSESFQHPKSEIQSIVITNKNM